MPTLQATSSYEKTTEQLSHTVPLPTGIVAGELLIVTDRGLINWSTPAGWTKLNWTSSGLNHQVFTKTAAGGETDIVLEGTVARGIAAACFRISDWLDFEIQTVDADALTPPTITPTWGDANETLFIAAAGTRPTNFDITGAPAGFGGFFTIKNTSSTSNSRFQIAGASQSTIVNSLSPGAFTVDGTPTDSNAWIIAVQGAAVTTENWGFRLTDIKEPNTSDTLVTGVSTARVRVWLDGDDTGAPSFAPIVNQSITAGAMEVEIPSGDNTDSPIVEVDWDAGGGETKFFRTAVTVIDLDA